MPHPRLCAFPLKPEALPFICVPGSRGGDPGEPQREKLAWLQNLRTGPGPRPLRPPV